MMRQERDFGDTDCLAEDSRTPREIWVEFMRASVTEEEERLVIISVVSKQWAQPTKDAFVAHFL